MCHISQAINLLRVNILFSAIRTGLDCSSCALPAFHSYTLLVNSQCLGETAEIEGRSFRVTVGTSSFLLLMNHGYDLPVHPISKVQTSN